MRKEERFYYYEIKLPEKLFSELKTFADEHNEEFYISIQRTLEQGLKIKETSKERLSEIKHE